MFYMLTVTLTEMIKKELFTRWLADFIVIAVGIVTSMQ
jgi:hypothetical protein